LSNLTIELFDTTDQISAPVDPVKPALVLRSSL
jgi:hypothetical protein